MIHFAFWKVEILKMGGLFAYKIPQFNMLDNRGYGSLHASNFFRVSRLKANSQRYEINSVHPFTDYGKKMRNNLTNLTYS